MDYTTDILRSLLENPHQIIIWIATIGGIISFAIWQVAQIRKQLRDSFKEK